MPVSRLTAEGLAEQVAGIYGDAEVELLRLIAQYLEAGADVPGWAEAKLAQLQLFRRQAEQLVAGATATAVATVTTAVEQAYLRGAAAGQGDLDAGGVPAASPPRHAERQVRALVQALNGHLRRIGPQIVRAAADAYRDAVVRASTPVLLGARTRLQAAQVALDDLARRGIRGFTDASGRRWSLRSYVEMATRSTAAQAAIHGHLDRLTDAGISLVIVSDAAGECDRCRPWEGKVLAQGPVPAFVPNVVTGELVPVHVDGTIAGAMAAGLFHPNCRHNVSAYLPGATKPFGPTADPVGNAARVRQRAMERTLREWKRRQATAVTPEARRKAAGKVREWQSAIRQHAAAHDLPRKRNRESLTGVR